MLQGIKQFFSLVSENQDLQHRLYMTKEISDVALIAKELGFSLESYEILRIQVGRILMLSGQELELIASGMRAKSGAQWGRNGGGYLDQAGFWINEFIKWGILGSAFEPQIEAFLTKVKDDDHMQKYLVNAKSYDDIAKFAKHYGYNFDGSILLRYIAVQILKLNNDKAENVAYSVRSICHS